MPVFALVASGAAAGGIVALTSNGTSRQAPVAAVGRPGPTTEHTTRPSSAHPTKPAKTGAPHATKRPALAHTTSAHTAASTSALPPVVKAVQTGCPPPPTPEEPITPPWHPAVLVPVSALPAVLAPAPWKSDLSALTGKGMWIWQWPATDGGDARAVVQQAVRAGLHSLWVRVGDSSDGFYGASELDALVPLAHAAGLKVIAWGFPYLYDPVGDARWTAQVLDWRGPAGQAVDGFSADIEMSTEGVALTAQRAGVYLEAVRRVAGDRPLVATVYPPTNTYWYGIYPYRMIARYVDAFAPMIYWECTDPGADATEDIARLSALRPVDIIGQAFNMAGYGRAVSPSGAELTEFMAAGERAGALGASFWVWQDATSQEWTALAAYKWKAR